MTRPYKAKVTLGKGSEYKYYIRKNSSSIVAKGADETELYLWLQQYRLMIDTTKEPQ